MGHHARRVGVRAGFLACDRQMKVDPRCPAVDTAGMRAGLTRILRRSLGHLAVGLGFLCLSVSAQAPLDIRIALVIGNAAYPGAPLANPVNDAKGMADTLRSLGFTVVQVIDGRHDQMADAIARVSETLKGKRAVGMLYYAGHGLQLDWRNYMVPVDAKLRKPDDIITQTVDVGSVIEAFKGAGNRMNILVLDACRDNPFGVRVTGRGLAQLDAPPGTLLAFATAPGNVAEDGEADGNGLYTQYLLQELRKPTEKIEDVFKRVRLQVRQKSEGRQIPWESTSLEDDFYFNDGVKFTFKPEELKRLADQARQKEQMRLQQEQQARERERLAAEALASERARQAEQSRLAEQQRLDAEARAREAGRLAAEASAREQTRLQAEAQAREQQRLQRRHDLTRRRTGVRPCSGGGCGWARWSARDDSGGQLCLAACAYSSGRGAVVHAHRNPSRRGLPTVLHKGPCPPPPRPRPICAPCSANPRMWCNSARSGFSATAFS